MLYTTIDLLKDETTHLLLLLLLCHILFLLHIMVDRIDSFKADQFVVKDLISSLVSFGGCEGGLERDKVNKNYGGYYSKLPSA